MSNYGTPYGSTAVCGRYTGELNEIAKILNSWRVSCDDQFVVSENRISLTQTDVEGPSIYPHRIVLHMPNGLAVFRDRADVATITQAEYEEDGDLIPLRKISEKISPFLHTGTIELYAIATYHREDGGYLERLAIRSDGYVERESIGCHDVFDEPYEREVYDPLTSTHPNFRAYLH